MIMGVIPRYYGGTRRKNDDILRVAKGRRGNPKYITKSLYNGIFKKLFIKTNLRGVFRSIDVLYSVTKNESMRYTKEGTHSVTFSYEFYRTTIVASFTDITTKYLG
eukprot:78078_1